MTKQYKSPAFAAIHESIEALHEIGAVDKQTMLNFDAACLTPTQQFTPAQIQDKNPPQAHGVAPL